MLAFVDSVCFYFFSGWHKGLCSNAGPFVFVGSIRRGSTSEVAAIDDTIDVEGFMCDELTPSEVKETRWILKGSRAIRPFVESIGISWRFLRWLAGELKWIAISALFLTATFKGEILSFLSGL